MSLKEYSHLTDLFDKLNSRKDTGEEFASMSEGEKMKFFWKDCMPEKIDASSMMEKTRQKIKRDEMRRRKNYFLVASVSIAASVLICISTIYFLNQSENDKTDLQAIVEQMETPAIDEVTLITSQKQLNLNQDPYIKYTKEGSVAVNSQDVLEEEVEGEGVAEAEEYDQLLVPAGKRAKIELSDGTLMTVNSQSKVIYPRRFKGEIRKIYAQGEVFLEVAHDKKHPFIVEANGFNLQVLGTKFNISNYEGEAANIVLVEGSVEVTDANEKKTRMVPSDLLNITDGAIAYQKQVDVNEYISWIDGVLIFDGSSLAEAVRKLGKYYGTPIQCDPEVGKQKVYGKLDVKDNIDEVLAGIQQTLSFTIVKKDGSIYLDK